MQTWRSLLGWMGLLGLVPLLACGPFFPENALDKPKGVLQPPLFQFTGELYQLKHDLLDSALAARQAGSPAYTLDLEMAEMEEIMKERLSDETQRLSWLASYRGCRRAMILKGDESQHAMGKTDRESAGSLESIQKDWGKVLGAVPEDVRLYLEGALLHLEAADAANAKAQQAREKWRQVLALPVEQRQWRSTWAAWMLFRTADPTQTNERGRWLFETRDLAQTGFADCLHLGIEAAYVLGRPGSDLPQKAAVSPAEWKRSAYQRAILGHSHADSQLKSDRWQYSAWSEELAVQTLADPFLRQAQLLHLIEVVQGVLGWDFGHYEGNLASPDKDLKAWLQSFEKSELKEQKETVLLAWLYYNAARFDESKRWLKMAPAEDVIALSLRGKLAAMEGKKDASVKNFEALAKQLPEAQDSARAQLEVEAQINPNPISVEDYGQVRRHHFLADYGRAQLATNDFVGALKTFSKTDFWDDTAYIAERLLSVEELLAMDRAGAISKSLQSWRYEDEETSTQQVKTIRDLADKYGGWERPQGLPMMKYLIGRRLVREHYFKDAQRLLPDELALALEHYAKAFRQGHDRKLSKVVRAEALWQAAQIHRLLGMEMIGFETGPDYAVISGAFELRDLASFRQQKVWVDDWIHDSHLLVAERQIPTFEATPAEKWRSKHYAPVMNKRFHYRYVAADLAWEAASLMPDDHPKTAEVLCIAGNWLQIRDAAAADRFYKALVRRNPNVPLAQEANRKRWFPAVKWDFDLALKTP